MKARELPLRLPFLSSSHHETVKSGYWFRYAPFVRGERILVLSSSHVSSHGALAHVFVNGVHKPHLTNLLTITNLQDQAQRVEISLLPEAISKPASSPIRHPTFTAEGIEDQENAAALEVSVHHLLQGHLGVGDNVSDSDSEGVEEQVSLETFQSPAKRRTEGTEDIELDFRHNMLEEVMACGKQDDGERDCVKMGKESAAAESQEETAAKASLKDARVSVSKGRNVWEERIARDKQARGGGEGSHGRGDPT